MDIQLRQLRYKLVLAITTLASFDSGCVVKIVCVAEEKIGLVCW